MFSVKLKKSDIKKLKDKNLKKYAINNKTKSIGLVLEWTGVTTAITYSTLIALNIGAEFSAFGLLLLSALLIGAWSFLQNHMGILILQLFYASAALIGLVRWY